jgi:hypothetical protein
MYEGPTSGNAQKQRNCFDNMIVVALFRRIMVFNTTESMALFITSGRANLILRGAGVKNALRAFCSASLYASTGNVSTTFVMVLEMAMIRMAIWSKCARASWGCRQNKRKEAEEREEGRSELNCKKRKEEERPKKKKKKQ